MLFRLWTIKKYLWNRFHHYQMWLEVLMTCHFVMWWLIFDMFGICGIFSGANALWTAYFRLFTLFLLFCVMWFFSTWKRFWLSVIYYRKQKSSKTCQHDNSRDQEGNFYHKTFFFLLSNCLFVTSGVKFCVFILFVRAPLKMNMVRM